MSYKKPLYSGIIICAISLVAGFLWTFLGIYGSFEALRSNDGTESIAVVGEGIESAFLGSVITIAGLLIGLILVAIGGVKAYKQSKSKTASGE